jgi:hypothetical protein
MGHRNPLTMESTSSAYKEGTYASKSSALDQTQMNQTNTMNGNEMHMFNHPQNLSRAFPHLYNMTNTSGLLGADTSHLEST